MADKPETKLLGLHGLFIEAQRRNDAVAARGFAEEAAKEAPSLAWAGQATFDFHCAEGDWAGALRSARAQQPRRAPRQGHLSAPARGAADRAGALPRGDRPRRGERTRRRKR